MKGLKIAMVMSEDLLNEEYYVVNKDRKGFYEDNKDNVIENFLETFYGKTVSMTRCEFDNYLLKCISEMSEFMTETTNHVNKLEVELMDHVEVMKELLIAMEKDINQIKDIRDPNEEDVNIINRRIDLLANKLELLARQTGKLELIKGFFSNSFASEG